MSNPKQLNYTQQLEHRLRMVQDDLKIIKKFIMDEELSSVFEEMPSDTSDCAMHNINNIEAACDLKSDECLSWTPYKTHKP